MNNTMSCAVCGGEHVATRIDLAPSEYKGRTEEVPIRMLECETCGSEFAGATESRNNKRAVVAFRKRVDGLLSGAEVRALREHYGISQYQAAELFGGGPVAFSKYENDDVTQSESMDRLLRLVRDNESAFWTLVQQSSLAGTLLPSWAKKKVWHHHEVITNVIVADFGANAGFRPSQKVQTQRYVISDRTGGDLLWN